MTDERSPVGDGNSAGAPSRDGVPDPALPSLMIVGVRLRPGGRSVACDADGHALAVGTRVVVSVDRGPEVGVVMVAPAWRPSRGRVPRVLRVADQRDLARAADEDRRVVEALDFARKLVRERNLPIKMFHAEIHGGGRATFYFASEARIDFRDLVRDLGSHLRLRIELRQIGVRDEAKMVGGIGACGRELCCSTFLPRFAPISIKAAKTQNLSLAPSKVSGQCGRLKCCLVYEEANYIEAAKTLPRVGKRVETPEGVGRVGDLDVLRGRVRVLFQDGPPKVFEGRDVKTLVAPGGGGPASGESADEGGAPDAGHENEHGHGRGPRNGQDGSGGRGGHGSHGDDGGRTPRG